MVHEPFKGLARDPVGDCLAEGQGIAAYHPQHTDNGNGYKAVHHGAKHIFGAHQATVEHGQARISRRFEVAGKIAGLETNFCFFSRGLVLVHAVVLFQRSLAHRP